ncbi:MAG TPA: AsmA-like C-terminal region-containing protein [Puia sp.]|nr:AsmA-like C-terminal region-containing protein [Puia sp.]
MKNKILKTLGFILLAIILLTSIGFYLFKRNIRRIVKTRLDKELIAHASFSDIDISWLRDFPHISVGLNNFQIIGVGEFDGDTLLNAKQLDLSCNPFHFILADSLSIYSISISDSRLHALILKNGHRNWDILRTEHSSTTAASSGKPLKWDLRKYAIHSGYINFKDETRNIHIETVGLEQEGKGHFNRDLFTVNTKINADAIQFIKGGSIPFQLSAKARMAVALKINRKTNTITFANDDIYLNDLKLHSVFYFRWINDSSYDMNISFRSPNTEFKNVLSLLSPVYQRDFESLKSSGSVGLNAFVIGKYDSKHSPAYHLSLDVKNGFFQYPDLPIPVKNINLAVNIDNPDGIMDHALLNIPKAHLEIDNDSLDFHLLIKNPKSNPFIDMAFSGKMDLANITRLMKLESGTKLSGMLQANIYAKGNTSVANKQRKNKFTAAGNFSLKDFLYISRDYPDGIVLTDLLLTLNAKNTQINELKGGYLSTHFDATGTFNNVFDFAMKNNPLQASIDLKADEINLSQWLGSVRDSAKLHASVTAPAALEVPANINFTIKASIDNFHQGNLDMHNLSGTIAVSDETLHFKQVKADALDGTMLINGTYSTREGRENPVISLTYDVNGVDIQKTFFAFNTLQKMMPVGRFMSGKFNSHINVNGSLDQDMLPNCPTLHGDGNIVLTEGSLRAFGPIDRLSQTLDIKELKDISLKDVHADFSFEGGKVVLNAFPAHAGDIDMEIFGSHGFDQTLAYDINLSVPRSKLGHKGTAFVKNVVKDAADKGIPVKLDESVNILVKLGGTINNPDVKTDMSAVVDKASEDLQKEMNEFVNAKLDSARQQLRRPAASKKSMFVQTTYKPRKTTKSKKPGRHAHNKTSSSKSKKNTRSKKKYESASLTGAKNMTGS